MQDLLDYAEKNGITLQNEGNCQFGGAQVSQGVWGCLSNIHRVAEILNFNNPIYYETRFLSVDALALQHCEIHGPWNNHIHLARLFLIFEKNVAWDYSKTPQLSNIINHYKKNKKAFLAPPPLTKRGRLTTSDLLTASSPGECMKIVREWAREVYISFKIHHTTVRLIGENYIKRYYA